MAGWKGATRPTASRPRDRSSGGRPLGGGRTAGGCGGNNGLAKGMTIWAVTVTGVNPIHQTRETMDRGYVRWAGALLTMSLFPPQVFNPLLTQTKPNLAELSFFAHGSTFHKYLAPNPARGGTTGIIWFIPGWDR